MTGELSVMNRSGDAKIIWNSDNEDEVEAARAMFDDLRGKGHLAYAVRGRGDKGEQLMEFDPEAEKIILAPPMRGG